MSNYIIKKLFLNFIYLYYFNVACLTGTYIDNGNCKWCIYPCVDCYSATECVTCGWGTALRHVPTPYGAPYLFHGEPRYHYDNMTCPCISGYYI